MLIKTVDLSIKTITRYQAPDGLVFGTEQEAYEYTSKYLSCEPLNRVQLHNFQVGDLVSFTDEIDLMEQRHEYATSVLKVLGEEIITEWVYYTLTKKYHLTTYNKLITWVVNRIPEGDVDFELSFTGELIKDLKKYN